MNGKFIISGVTLETTLSAVSRHRQNESTSARSANHAKMKIA